MPKFIRQNDNTLTGNNTFSGTNTFSGAVVSSGGITVTGPTRTLNPVNQNTIVVIDAQNGTPTIAELLRGIVTHNSKTGAGTLTVPTGALMSAGVTDVAIGSTFRWLYYNYGNQTVTITPADGHTLVGGTAAVTTGKHMEITSVCTAANTWVSYLTTLM
ncbi:MAG: hypothetical protein M0R80_17445 [Proteobacteria bacterium]|jgi:hypothetical protein|nr:hypothetical protein [Pseudomonadota bacterium]